MATRPIFVPAPDYIGTFVNVRNLDFQWYSGLAVTQKQKSIASLHNSAKSSGVAKSPLEISSKSPDALGRRLSAFNLSFHKADWPECRVEQTFQSSKVFRGGGPFTDIVHMQPREAKRDPRLKNSGSLVAFEFAGKRWPLEPKTLLYDWIYLNAVFQNPLLASGLQAHDGFTDIEFNPIKSLNCQARSAALYVALSRAELLDEALSTPERYRKILSSKCTGAKAKPAQGVLL